MPVIGVPEVQVPLTVQGVLLDIGQDQDGPAHFTISPQSRWGELLIGVMVVVYRKAELLEVVAAAHATGGFTHLLHGRHEQANEHSDNGDDHQ